MNMALQNLKLEKDTYSYLLDADLDTASSSTLLIAGDGFTKYFAIT